jgi:ABC-2 type transport system ATP-binding protein
MAVNNLTLTVEEGEIFGFVGPNGAGKSTTIKILCDLIRPSSGRVALMGKDVTSVGSRRQMGYLPENPSYYDYLTGEELLGFNGAIHGMKGEGVRQRVRELLKIMELEDAASRLIRTYSKGMVQRLGIAASLIHDPKVVIWDEPMSGLDPIGRRQTVQLMQGLRKQGKSIFFSTHILGDVEQVCDRIGMIVGGRLVYTGRLEEILTAATEEYRLIFKLEEGPMPTLPEAVDLRDEPGGLYYLEVPAEAFDKTLRGLLAGKIEIMRIEPKRLRLEDVFVKMANKK